MVDPIVDGRPPQDTTGDGLYNDITGDGLFNTYDVEVFNDSLNHPTVANNPSRFNFSGGERIGPFDVQALFGMLDEHGTGTPGDNPGEFASLGSVSGEWTAPDTIGLSVGIAVDDVYTPPGVLDVPVTISPPGSDAIEFIQSSRTGQSQTHEYEVDVSSVDQQEIEVGVMVAGGSEATVTLNRANEPDGGGMNPALLAAGAGLAFSVLRRVRGS
jgi:hypothetical protein